jgi:hypothetical protein
MNAARIGTVFVATVVLITSSVAGASAQADVQPCGFVFARSYAPVITECNDWVIQRFPKKPTFKKNRWVINDDGLEFTLMYNTEVKEYPPKDLALLFYRETGAQVRFGVAQPLDGTEPTSDYLENHIGLYVESEYTGDWVRYGLPRGEK